MKIEWDDEKADRNIKIHGISFQVAAKVFRDINRIELYDEKHSSEEDRWITIGCVDDVLYVCYTIREYNGDESVRLISARIATPKERREYYGFCNN